MKAKIQARVYSAPKIKLETVVPLATPYSVHIDVCSLCNFKCTFCFQSDEEGMREKGLKRGLMDFELFKKISDDMTHFKDKLKKVKIGLHGEPTIHPQLPEMISYLKSRDVTPVIEMFTNGSFLNPKLNRAIIDAGLRRINISVEGLTSEKYKEVAGVKFDMEKFVRNIKDLYDVRKNCCMYIKILDVGLSDRDKGMFYSTFGDICDEIFIEQVVPQWAEANKFALQATGIYGQKTSPYKHVCPFPFMYLHFNYEGTASACTLDWAKEVLIGDIRNESALEIWEGERLRNLRIAHLEKRRCEVPFCNKCLAPMVCCEENLDESAGDLLEKIRKN
jgi:MoaA/NifB/PqqE/SkfB family radical SAM enzyme